jgi:hypothetical protein
MIRYRLMGVALLLSIAVKTVAFETRELEKLKPLQAKVLTTFPFLKRKTSNHSLEPSGRVGDVLGGTLTACA